MNFVHHFWVYDTRGKTVAVIKCECFSSGFHSELSIYFPVKLNNEDGADGRQMGAAEL